ncbi:hypothetical protein PV08_02564 [Exophiala spinifera]|uniref:Uncharacterized protein n=1 Tax=Exophiala spinifera TaxID=91928 RepID=A0A0D1YSM9_9EURO|nr:uncharacterized protein PV08_02564 [Exophiala spinifera]KIW18276.1 hypothetical protein PV08_02564 [Exophiala spinifera]
MPSANAAAPPLPTPTPDELDDLIYFSRVGDLDSLKEVVTNLCATHSCPPSVIVASAIDVDEDGLGSQSSLLHYPAANGNLEIVKYILGLLTPSDALGSSVGATTADKSAPSLVNHKNVNGNTPLHWAGMNGHLEVVKALVGAGADPGIANAAGRDAVFESEISAKEGASECAEWMLKECEGLEKGVGVGHEEGEAAQEDVDSMGQEEASTSENGTAHTATAEKAT